ncbi:protein kintoun [Corythoichthys intestinalis]|uniref:protein kintoun n=1 Tax=Corythoichthys intestinalis TaxID=161448 RepID=UPI0025A548BC|nr:protein kintoun [Corythoichthys intestinalis]XP_057715254.1 protein kintoun [Corythoichthys intestinalis]
MEIGEKLKELNMTADEVARLTKAFKDEKFREMFNDYAQELSNPENRRLYEEEIAILEQERGNNIEFIHPKPFRSLRTSVNRKQKCYINICANDKVGKPRCKSAVSDDGRRGQSWTLPHNLHPGRQETDPKGNKIMIYDVIFHPDTLHIANKKAEFMEMVSSTAIQGIQDAFKVTLDKNNVREMTTKYKGTPQPCVIRKPIPGYTAKPPEENPLAFPYPDDKKTKISPDLEPRSFEIKNKKTKEPTEPSYTVKYRSFIDMQDFRCSRDSGKSPRPKEIVVTIDVPLLKSVADANLEVKEKSLLLESETPAYRLELPLSYPVDEEKGSAKFSKQKGQLTVTLPVLPSSEAAEFCWGENATEAEESQVLEENVMKDVKGEEPVNGDWGEGTSKEEQRTSQIAEEERRVEEERREEEFNVQDIGEPDGVYIEGDREPQMANQKEDGCENDGTLEEHLEVEVLEHMKEYQVNLNENESLRKEECLTRQRTCEELMEKVLEVEEKTGHKVEDNREQDNLSFKENLVNLKENEHQARFQKEEASIGLRTCKEPVGEEQVEERKKHDVDETGEQDTLCVKECQVNLNENENQAAFNEEELSIGQRTYKETVEEPKKHDVNETAEQDTLSVKESLVNLNENEHQAPFHEEELSIGQRTCKEPVEEPKKHDADETEEQDALSMKENQLKHMKENQVNLNENKCFKEEECSTRQRTCEELMKKVQKVEENSRHNVEETTEQDSLSFKEDLVNLNENEHQAPFKEKELSRRQRTCKELVDEEQVEERKKQDVDETEEQDALSIKANQLEHMKENQVNLNENERFREEECSTRQGTCEELMKKVLEVEEKTGDKVEDTREQDTLSFKENHVNLNENEHQAPFQEKLSRRQRTCKELLDEEQVQEGKKHHVDETEDRDGLSVKENLVNLNLNKHQTPLQEKLSRGQRTCKEPLEEEQDEERKKHDVDETEEQHVLSMKENQINLNHTDHKDEEECLTGQRTCKELVEDVEETPRSEMEETGEETVLCIKERQVNLKEIQSEDQVREIDEPMTIDSAHESSSSGEDSRADAFLVTNALTKEATTTQEKDVKVDEPCGEPSATETSLKNTKDTPDEASIKVGGGETSHGAEESANLSTKDDEECQPGKQPTQHPKADKNPPPLSLREIDKDGNVTVLSDHVTSAGFVFQNSLVFELD